jgi:hypothetical protein
MAVRDTPQPSTPSTPARRPSSLRYRLFVIAGLLLAAAAFTAAVVSTDTDEDPPVTVSGRPDIVEHVLPPDGAAIQRQSEIGIDLAPGYEGTLVVYGQEIPAPQLRLVPEQNQVFFTAGEGKVIEVLEAGRTCVTAVAWRSQDGRGVRDQRIEWCFAVT